MQSLIYIMQIEFIKLIWHLAGIAVGTVSLPVLSKAFKKKNISKLSKIQNKSIELSLLLINTSKCWFNFGF